MILPQIKVVKMKMEEGSTMTERFWQQAEGFLSEHDPIMAGLVEEFGACTLEPQEHYFQVLCESIIGQQISTKVAEAILARFKALFADQTADPAELMDLSFEELREAGLSKRKIEYVRDLALKVMDGEVKLGEFDQLSNQVIEKQLLSVKGIGPWTVTMFFIFALNRTDILPVGDLGVKKAIQALYGFADLPTTDEMKELGKAWHPYESIATWYLWKSLHNKD